MRAHQHDFVSHVPLDMQEPRHIYAYPANLEQQFESGCMPMISRLKFPFCWLARIETNLKFELLKASSGEMPLTAVVLG